jgi:hypothetical protein
MVGRDNVVGIVTPYGLDGPGVESRWGQYFQHQKRLALGPNWFPLQWVLGYPRGKVAGAWH